jgi:hypothetical protein
LGRFLAQFSPIELMSINWNVILELILLFFLFLIMVTQERKSKTSNLNKLWKVHPKLFQSGIATLTPKPTKVEATRRPHRHPCEVRSIFSPFVNPT